MELVEVKRGEVFCDSHMVHLKFKKRHAEVVKRIKKLQTDLENNPALRVVSNHPKISVEARSYRGNDYTAYLMNRPFFSLLAMRFEGVIALEWQIKFNDAFYLMEERLLAADQNAANPSFLAARTAGKITRRKETDAIKEFVEYASIQGSGTPKFYYKHFTNASYAALGLITNKKPKLRDTLDIMEIAELQLMEHRAQVLILKYMELGRHYKDIYTTVRDDLVDFANALRIE